jgi:hypothetical protein
MRKNDDLKLPMSDELLEEFNFFELYPFDGGGNFINAEILGSVDDRKIAEDVLNGALNKFGCLPKLGFAKFERWRSVEKSCWLNRCYFIVPLAKYYHTTGDENVAALVKDIILYFMRNYHPPQSPEEIKSHLEYVYYIRDNNYNQNSYEENQRDETDVKYIWFDFQPASRIIHFLYALNFIKGSETLSDAEFDEIVSGIKSHAQLIAVSEGRFEKLKSPGNHQSIRGLSLLYAGAVFKDDFFLNEGIRICKFHIENDYFSDGVLKEISPSYHVFETWHVRDAYILAKEYGFKVSDKHEKVLSAAVEFVSSIHQPDGNSTVIDDGYALFLAPFMKSIPREIRRNVDKHEQKTSYFPDAQLAFYQDVAQYICFDDSLNPSKFSHYHAGKNGVTYFYKDSAVLIDSGCCSYDDPDFSKYKNAGAHSSLLINGSGDGVFEGLYYCPHYTTPECSGWNANEISGVIESSVPEWSGINWKRTLRVKNAGFELNDQVKNISGDEREFTFIFNFHPEVECSLENEKQILIKTSEDSLLMEFKASCEFEICKAEGQCFIDSRHQKNTQVHVKIKARNDFTLNLEIGTQ